MLDVTSIPDDLFSLIIDGILLLWIVFLSLCTVMIGMPVLQESDRVMMTIAP